MATDVHWLPFWAIPVYCLCARNMPIKTCKITDKIGSQSIRNTPVIKILLKKIFFDALQSKDLAYHKCTCITMVSVIAHCSWFPSRSSHYLECLSSNCMLSKSPFIFQR